MTRIAGTDCAVVCNLLDTHTRKRGRRDPAKAGKSSTSIINRRLLLRNPNSRSSTTVFAWEQTRLLSRTLVGSRSFVADSLFTVRFSVPPTITTACCETFSPLSARKKLFSSPNQTSPCKWWRRWRRAPTGRYRLSGNRTQGMERSTPSSPPVPVGGWRWLQWGPGKRRLKERQP